MNSGTKKRLAAGLTAGAMMLSIASPAMAQVTSPVQLTTGGLISVLNNPNVTITNVQVVDVDNTLNDNKINVRALNNFLNNSLNNNNVEVLTDFLNANQIDISDIVDIAVVGTTLVVSI